MCRDPQRSLVRIILAKYLNKSIGAKREKRVSNLATTHAPLYFYTTMSFKFLSPAWNEWFIEEKRDFKMKKYARRTFIREISKNERKIRLSCNRKNSFE